MFKEETVAKVESEMKRLYSEFTARAELGGLWFPSISKGNRKIGRVMNVSIAPLLSCRSDCPCRVFCYDIKACLQYTGVRLARVKNLWLAVNRPDVYFGKIRESLSRRKSHKFFRWHVGGDIISPAYFAEMVQIAREYPDFVFWTYTKKYFIVNNFCDKNGGRTAIPENLKIMFSEWDGMPVVNPYGFPEFSCKLKAGNKNHPESYFATLYKCPGNCDICKELGRGCLAGETTFADEH